METSKFLNYLQVFLNANEINLSKDFFNDFKTTVQPNNTIATLEIIYNIYNQELLHKETTFFTNRTLIPKLEEDYEKLKFLLRRYDFNIKTDDEAFCNFIHENNISTSAIILTINASIINKVKVLNDVAMLLYDKGQLTIATRLLNVAFQNSKDNTTLFHFAFILWKIGDFEAAENVINRISISDDAVTSLKNLILKRIN